MLLNEKKLKTLAWHFEKSLLWSYGISLAVLVNKVMSHV